MGHPKFEIKTAKNGEFMFNLTAKNGQVIFTSQQYTTKAACKNGIESVKNNSKEDGHFARKEAKNGEAYFDLMAANHQVIGKSQMYSSKAAMEKGIDSVMENAGVAEIEDMTA